MSDEERAGWIILGLFACLLVLLLVPDQAPKWEQQWARHPVTPLKPPAPTEWVELQGRQWRYDPPGPFLIVVERSRFTLMPADPFYIWTLWYGPQAILQGSGKSPDYCKSQSLYALQVAETCDPSQFWSLPKPPY